MPYNPKGSAHSGSAGRDSNSKTAEGYTGLSQTGAGFIARNAKGISNILCQPLNVLLVCVPLGLFAGKKEWSCLYVFLLNFTSIIPLAGVLGASTEALAGHTGQMIGGLLNATFGNAVEMIVTINAIRAGLVYVVKTSLIGSILSNLLLVMGMAFVASHVVAKESSFNVTGAASNISCLVVASLALSLPTVFTGMPHTTMDQTVQLSRCCAIVMAIVYVLFLVFQLRTHSDLFTGEEEEEEEPELDLAPSIVLLFMCTCCVAACSEYLVDSISEVSEEYGLPQAFIGMILLPIVGNAAEHFTAVTAAMKGKMDLALGVAVGSSTQIALFVVPFSVVVGWFCDVDMSLDFDAFATVVFVLSVFIASSVLGDGSANWFEGVMLVASYTVVAVICWFLPNRHEGAAHHAAKEASRRLADYKVFV